MLWQFYGACHIASFFVGALGLVCRGEREIVSESSKKSSPRFRAFSDSPTRMTNMKIALRQLISFRLSVRLRLFLCAHAIDGDSSEEEDKNTP